MQGAWICTFFPTKKVIDNLLLSLRGPEGQCSLELHIYDLLYFAPLLPKLVISPVNHVLWKQNKLVIWGQGSLFYSKFRVFWCDYGKLPKFFGLWILRKPFGYLVICNNTAIASGDQVTVSLGLYLL